MSTGIMQASFGPDLDAGEQASGKMTPMRTPRITRASKPILLRVLPALWLIACGGEVSSTSSSDAGTRNEGARVDAAPGVPNQVTGLVNLSGSAGSAETAPTAFALTQKISGSVGLVAQLPCGGIFISPNWGSEGVPRAESVNLDYLACGETEAYLHLRLPLSLGSYPSSVGDDVPNLVARVGPTGSTKRRYESIGATVEVTQVEGARVAGTHLLVDHLAFRVSGRIAKVPDCGAAASCASGGDDLVVGLELEVSNARLSF